MKLYYRYLRKLESDIRTQEQNVNVVEKEMEIHRLVLLDATKDRKVLENLKENKYKSYITDLIKKEQAVIDDVAIFNFSGER